MWWWWVLGVGVMRSWSRRWRRLWVDFRVGGVRRRWGRWPRRRILWGVIFGEFRNGWNDRTCCYNFSTGVQVRHDSCRFYFLTPSILRFLFLFPCSIRYDSHKNATIALGYQGASWTDPKTMPLALMTTLLGSYTSSSGIGKNIAATMCQEVAEIASSISAFNLSYSDTGLFGVVATAPDNMLDDLMWNVMPNLVRLAHGVSEEEMARAKLALKAQILSSMDGEIAAGEEMARQIQTIGRVMPLAEAMARVDALTMDDVKAAANEVINDQDHALAAIGGIHELPDYNWIRRKSYMLRY
eukprot:CCRYP_009779-RA/>CCRYP_009779-RA protein AED:0.11 eAED:0.11 QI:863/1/1/1/1/1/3/184/297